MARNNDLFVNVLETLKNDILSGKYPFQSKIPSEAYLARELNISRTTLRKVLEALKDAGLIEPQKGSGWFVCNKNIVRYIPIVIPKNSNNYRMTDIFEGAHNYFDKVGFSSLLTITDDDPKKEQELIKKLIADGHDNFLIYPTSCDCNSKFYQRLLRQGCNCVFIDTLPNKITCDYVTSCNFLGGYEATKELIKLGHKNIAFCTLPNPEGINTVNDRYLGYLSALEQNKIKPSDDLIFIQGNEDYTDFCGRILKNENITAIFASTDEFAVLLSKLFSESDRHPAIVGFDNIVLSETFDIASVNQNLYEIGRTAAELLYKRIVDPSKNYEHIFVPVFLIERGSLTKPEKN